MPHVPTSRGKIENILSTPPAQPLIRTDNGNSVSYIIKAPFTMSTDSDGRHISFSHCPKLSFPSMQYAFDYFLVQAKLHNQRVNQVKWEQQRLDSQSSLQATQKDVQAAQQSQAMQQVQAAQPSIKVSQMHLPMDQRDLEYLSLQAEQLAKYAAQQAYLVNALSTCGPARHHKKPNDSLSLVEISTPPRSIGSDSRYQHASEPSAQNLWKERGPVYSTSGSLPPESPPQTLFAESTPHAREIQAQRRLILPVQGLQSWPFQPKPTKNDSFLQFSSPRQNADQRMMLTDSYDPSLTYADTVLSQSLANEVHVSVRPTNSDKLNPLPSSYANTVLPQTLNKKDRRVLGVPISAGIDEYVLITPRAWIRTSHHLFVADISPIVQNPSWFLVT